MTDTERPSLPPAGWQLDPTGRYRGRYWDGTAWTAHVSNGATLGVEVDPMHGPSRAAAATDSPDIAVPSGPTDPSCPYCNGPVLATAQKCRHCGEFLDAALKAERAREARAEKERLTLGGRLSSTDEPAGVPPTPIAAEAESSLKEPVIVGTRRRIPVRVGLAVLALSALVLTGAVVLGGSSGRGEQSDTQRITGTVALTDYDSIVEAVIQGGNDEVDDLPCTGLGGFDDIQAGAEVVLRDETGQTIGTAQLEPGMTDSSETLACVFAFDFGESPDAEFYEVEVMSRGAVRSSRAELAGQQWEFALTIG